MGPRSHRFVTSIPVRSPSARAARFGQTGYSVLLGRRPQDRPRFPFLAGRRFKLRSAVAVHVGKQIGRGWKNMELAIALARPATTQSGIPTKEMVDDPAKAIFRCSRRLPGSAKSGKGNNLTEYEWRKAHQMYKAGSAHAFSRTACRFRSCRPPSAVRRRSGAAGAHTSASHTSIRRCRRMDRIGMVLGTAPVSVSWLVYQEAGKLYGCVDDNAPPAKADSYTARQPAKADLQRGQARFGRAGSRLNRPRIALATAGPRQGHIAVCDDRGTI